MPNKKGQIWAVRGHIWAQLLKNDHLCVRVHGCMNQNEKTFSPSQKICHKYIWQKLECKKVVSKFEGVGFYRKFYENFTPTAYSLRGSTSGGQSGMPCAALPGVGRKAAKPFEMAACSSCNALRAVGIGRFCKACTARIWAYLHSSPGAAWIRCGVVDVVPYWAALRCLAACPSTVAALTACGIGLHTATLRRF